MSTQEQDENDLMQKAQNGDLEALAQVFEINRERLKRMIRMRMSERVRPRVAVSDVLQEAYVDLAQQLGNYANDPKLPFFLWMRRVTGLTKATKASIYDY